jgi:hypothetical protein
MLHNSTYGYTRADTYDYLAIQIAWNETMEVGNRATEAWWRGFPPCADRH